MEPPKKVGPIAQNRRAERQEGVEISKLHRLAEPTAQQGCARRSLPGGVRGLQQGGSDGDDGFLDARVIPRQAARSILSDAGAKECQVTVWIT